MEQVVRDSFHLFANTVPINKLAEHNEESHFRKFQEAQLYQVETLACFTLKQTNASMNPLRI